MSLRSFEKGDMINICWWNKISNRVNGMEISRFWPRSRVSKTILEGCLSRLEWKYLFSINVLPLDTNSHLVFRALFHLKIENNLIFLFFFEVYRIDSNFWLSKNLQHSKFSLLFQVTWYFDYAIISWRKEKKKIWSVLIFLMAPHMLLLRRHIVF